MATGIIKRAGFKKVKSAGFFRASNEEKGGKLCRSRHVFDVTEETTVGQSILKGRCVRQASVNQEAYAVIIELTTQQFMRDIGKLLHQRDTARLVERLVHVPRHFVSFPPAQWRHQLNARSP
ncbi:hypothetical protein HPB50_004030 [Hyalomma asiaticum]|uniref:Uncharacterized protein n=1 Tax=Hyalomma asiaticum TaxID=266040 RepID=A0ACB7SV26_HYAAI|nr:hypothetical protein HPB50_004030 [Hyalomma asiaticum]